MDRLPVSGRARLAVPLTVAFSVALLALGAWLLSSGDGILLPFGWLTAFLGREWPGLCRAAHV
jgi:hypothetical protein